LAQQCKFDFLIRKIVQTTKLLPYIEKPVNWDTFYPTKSFRKGVVSLFLGCTSSAIDIQTLKASIYVLNKLGFDIQIPSEQTCCGSIAKQMGDAKEFDKLLAKNKRCFNKDIPIITVVSGCGSGLHDDLLGFNIQDISTFLVNCDWSSTLITPMNAHIFVHDPCTLRNVQKSQQAVYDLLKKIPNTEISALPGNTQCCGGAGAYMITQSKMASDLRDDKINFIRSNNVDILTTSNIGCFLHIAHGLREQNLSVNLLHPVQIIAKQMGYVP
jgi:glycolate oxidase iron-sulfur subunit